MQKITEGDRDKLVTSGESGEGGISIKRGGKARGVKRKPQGVSSRVKHSPQKKGKIAASVVHHTLMGAWRKIGGCP